jgi:Glycosyltransferase family 87
VARFAPGRGFAVWSAVLGVYTASLLLERHGVLSPVHASDVDEYRRDARALVSGQLPYRDLYFEYPPGALAPIVVPTAFAGYAAAFKATMAVLGGGLLVVASTCLHALRRSLWWLLPVAVSPLLVGSVFVNRFDVWPALLATVALALFASGRPKVGAVLLSAGAVAQIFPLAAAPAVAIWIWRTRGYRALKTCVAVFVGFALVVLVPFAALGPGGLRYSFTIQLTRKLESESLGGAALLAAARLGLYHARLAFTNPGSLDLLGPLPDVVSTLSMVAVVAFVAWGAWIIAHGPLTTEAMVAGAVAAIAGYVAFGKVLSPQYLVWLVPLVPLVARGVPTLLLLVGLVLTQIEFDHDFGQIHPIGPVVWLLLARDLVLVALAFSLLRASRVRAPTPEPRPRALARPARGW